MLLGFKLVSRSKVERQKKKNAFMVTVKYYYTTAHQYDKTFRVIN